MRVGAANRDHQTADIHVMKARIQPEQASAVSMTLGCLAGQKRSARRVPIRDIRDPVSGTLRIDRLGKMRALARRVQAVQALAVNPARHGVPRLWQQIQ
jgi:hypothetical protein